MNAPADPPPVVVEVLAANAAFYQAFEQADLDAMDDVWARDAPVACVHPGWSPLSERVDILRAWQAIFDDPAPPQVTCEEEHVYIMGETAFVVCTERMPGGALAATNIYIREDDQWKMVHHHVSPIMREITGLDGDDDDDEETLSDEDDGDEEPTLH